MSDLREQLRRQAETMMPSEDWASGVERRVRSRSRLRRIGTVVIALGLTAVAVAVSVRAFGDRRDLVPAEQTGPANYVFSNVQVRDSSPPQGSMSFQMEWSSDIWPGIHRCAWTAYGQDGEVVGEFSRPFFHAEPIDPSGEAIQELRLERPAATASAVCDPERIDVGNPYAYEFDVLAVTPEREGSFVRWEIDVEMNWLGQGYPGVVDCMVSVTSGDETVVSKEIPITHDFETIGLAGEDAPRDGPYDARFDCRPHGTQEQYESSTVSTAPGAEDVVNGVGCYSATSGDAGFVVMEPVDGRLPTEICADAWERNDWTVDVPRGEPLVSCVPPTGESVWVYPGEDGLCEELGLFSLPDGYQAAAQAFAEMQAEMLNRFPEPGPSCLSEKSGREVAREVLDAHGYGDWGIEEGRGEAGEGFSQERPCADLSFNVVPKVLILVPSAIG